MAESAVSGRHLPALDGLRGLAVAGVLAYHLDLGWASGGYLGVDLFFVLSGFLITALLLEEWVGSGTISLRRFWARRARRLLPALFAMLVVLAAFVVAMGRWGPPGWTARVDLPSLRGDALATIFYVANWHAIVARQSYFGQFSAPSPLSHTWSLAIEEQFYLVWPLVLLALLGWSRRWRRSRPSRSLRPDAWRRRGMVLCGLAGAASAGLMAALYHPGGDPTRVYDGTDTRLFDLLAGAVVAFAVAARPQPGPRARRVLHVVGPLAAGGLAVAWAFGGTPSGEPRTWMFDGGFLVCAVLAAAVVADARLLDRGPLGVVLSWRPLRALGIVSYGVYLWHWPVFVYVDATLTGLSGIGLDALRLGITLILASASWLVVEQPLRRWRPQGWPRFALGPAAAVVTAVAVVVATIPSVAVAAPSAAVAAASASASVAGDGPVPGAGGTTGQPPLRLPAFGPGDPLRVTVLGDSVAAAAEPALRAALEASGEVRVTGAAADGFGLTTDPIWRTSLPAIVSSQRAQVVLATWSWDDSCSATEPTPFVHRATEVCALQHPVAYRRTLASAVRRMLAAGASAVVFLQFPTTAPLGPGRIAGEEAWDQAARAVAAGFPGRALYLGVAGSVLLHGQFTTWLPPAGRHEAPASAWLRVRTVDGVHLCPAGAARYAAAVLADLQAAVGLAPATPGWAGGRWSADPVYNTPPGACPADHP